MKLLERERVSKLQKTQSRCNDDIEHHQHARRNSQRPNFRVIMGPVLRLQQSSFSWMFRRYFD